MQQPIDGEEGKFEKFEHVVKVAIEKHIPLKSVPVNSQKPWINETLFKQIDKKRKLWDKIKIIKLTKIIRLIE